MRSDLYTDSHTDRFGTNDYNLEHLGEAAAAAEPMLYFLMIDLFDLLN